MNSYKPLALSILLSLASYPVLAQVSLLDRFKLAIQDRSEAAPVRRPQIKTLEVQGPLPDLKDQSCASNNMLRTARTTISEEVRKTDATHTFLDSEPVQKFSGISTVRLQGTVLSVTLASQGRFEEFAGPVANIVEKKHFEARPGTALLLHTFTLGLGLLFKPVDSTQHALGCTDSRVIRREVQMDESAPTGQSRWQDAATTHVLSIEGLGAPRTYNLSTTNATLRGPFDFELLPLIMQGGTDKPVELTVTCISCNAQEAQLLGFPATIQNMAVLSADFSDARTAELARLERIAQEERAARQRQIDAQQAILNFKRSLVGRWSSQETCLSGKNQSVGLVYEVDEAARLSLRSRVLEREQVVEQYSAQDIGVRLENPAEQVWELILNLRMGNNSGRMLTRTILLKVRDEQLQILDQRDGGNTFIRSGTVQAFGRAVPPSINCAHPRVVAQRGQLEREELERSRRAQAEAEERRLRLEREEAERKRRKEERDRLYKL